MNDDTQPFPIQADRVDRRSLAACSVPQWLAALAYKEYARVHGKSQTLRRLGERGGFGRAELVALLRGDYSMT